VALIFPKFSADVIGYVAKYSTILSRIPKGKERTAILREVFIRDIRYIKGHMISNLYASSTNVSTNTCPLCRDNELKVTLWADSATNFSVDDVYNEQLGNVIVVLFVGCMARQIFSKSRPILNIVHYFMLHYSFILSIFVHGKTLI